VTKTLNAAEVELIEAGIMLPDGRTGEWADRASCKETDPEAFFPEKGGSTREAKRVCARCEVKAECLKYALGTRQPYGIWGGLSERERRKLRNKLSSANDAQRSPVTVGGVSIDPGRIHPDRVAQVVHLRSNGHPVDEVVRETGVSPRQIRRVVANWEEARRQSSDATAA
jgi:WhiB family redox-sensing transcriptional regulator